MNGKVALQSELDAFKEKGMSMTPDEVVSAMMESGKKLAESGIIEQAKNVGDKAPDFRLSNVRGEEVSLSGILKKGAVALVFYRGAWCPYCDLQFKALQSALPRIKGTGATLVGISPSTPDNSLSMAEKMGLEFEVVSDVGNSVAREYGLVYTLDEILRPIYKGFGIDIPGNNGDDLYELPFAATYIIGTDRVIRYAFLDTDYTKRMEPALMVEELKKASK